MYCALTVAERTKDLLHRLDLPEKLGQLTNLVTQNASFASSVGGHWRLLDKLRAALDESGAQAVEKCMYFPTED